MRVWRVAIVAIAGLGAVAPSAEACSGAHAKLKAGNAGKVSRATVCLINRERAEAGLGKVRPDKKLRAAATKHSKDMVERRYFGHDGPSGDTVITRAQEVGYLRDVVSWALAENIAYGSGGRGTPAAIVRTWMKSPPHRANILNSSIQDAGVGLARGLPSGGGGATYTLNVGYARTR